MKKLKKLLETIYGICCWISIIYIIRNITLEQFINLLLVFGVITVTFVLLKLIGFVD